MPDRPQNQRNRTRHSAIAVLAALAAALCAAPGSAVDMLSAAQLASHCQKLTTRPKGAGGQFCIRYIQGFIDGAIAADERVMQHAKKAFNRTESFTERAIRTRVPNLADEFRAARTAGFCLGNPLPLAEVIDAVVTDLVTLPPRTATSQRARDIVYASLRRHYPCEE